MDLAGPNKLITLGGKMYDMVLVNAPLDLSHSYSYRGDGEE